MREDQRQFGHDHQDEDEEQFDDALDELFGPDDDDLPVRPRLSELQPPASTGSNLPERIYEPDPEHEISDEGHVVGPENEPPPPSYDSSGFGGSASERESRATVVQPDSSFDPPARKRDWRKYACFGCLAAVGIPALCLFVLIVIGILYGEDPTATPEAGGIFVDSTATIDARLPDEPAGTPTVSGEPLSSEDEPFVTIMDGRDNIDIEMNGEGGVGRLDNPVPLGVSAPLGDGWLLSIDSVTVDATDDILDANMFNEPPASDRQYIIAAVTATNQTNVSQIFDASYRLRLAGTISGNQYTTFDEEHRCGVVPDGYMDLDVDPGATNAGNICWQVLTSDAQSLVLYSDDVENNEGAIWFDLTVGESIS